MSCYYEIVIIKLIYIIACLLINYQTLSIIFFIIDHHLTLLDGLIYSIVKY